MTEKSLDGRIALVTGASRGFGYALAHALGEQGAHVLALARTVGALEELDEAITDAGGSATLIPADLQDGEGLDRLAAAIHGRWGKLDIWAHTAITAPPLSPVEHIDAKDLDLAIAVNFRVTQRLIRVLDPLLRKSDSGRVLHFADVDETARPNHATYLATKAASATLFESWQHALEAASNVRVTEVSIPPMPTTLRLRFHPGEDTGTLSKPSVIAEHLVAELNTNLPERLDLRT